MSEEVDKILDTMEKTADDEAFTEPQLIIDTAKKIRTTFKMSIKEFRQQNREFKLRLLNTEVVFDESLVDELTKKFNEFNSNLQFLKKSVPLLSERLGGWTRLYN